MDTDLAHLGLVDEADIMLDEAALALALLDHPDLAATPYHEMLDAIAARLGVVGADAVAARDRADALSLVIAGDFGFTGDRKTYDDPANADLVRVIDRRRGLPVSLSILYVAAARRLGWAADMLDVPGHVLVLVCGEGAPVIVDPFEGGIALEHGHLAAMLDAGPPTVPARVRQVAAMPNRSILVRLLLNQASRAEQAGRGRRALELYARMTAIAPSHGQAWWQRARLELADGAVTAARTSLAAMLEITREPGMRRRVTEMLNALVAT